MGEKRQNDNNPTPPQENNPPEAQDQPEDVNEDLDSEEFQHLDNQLNALFTALDDIESKNDNIHAQLLELLQANREIRKQLKEANENEETNENKETDNMDTQNS